MRSEDYGQLKNRMIASALRHRIPLRGRSRLPVFATSAANTASGPASKQCPLCGELLPRETWFRIIDEVTEAGTLFLTFSGGEPFTRPDFLDIYEHACHNGLLARIYTNGALISDAIADRLAACPPGRVDLSLYGMSDDAYEAVTRARHGYTLVMQAIERLLARHLRVGVRAVAMQGNFGDVRRMAEFCEQHGIFFRADSFVVPRWMGARRIYRNALRTTTVSRPSSIPHSTRRFWSTDSSSSRTSAHRIGIPAPSGNCMACSAARLGFPSTQSIIEAASVFASGYADGLLRGPSLQRDMERRTENTPHEGASAGLSLHHHLSLLHAL